MTLTEDLEKQMSQTYVHLEIEIRLSERLVSEPAAMVHQENAVMLAKAGTREEAYTIATQKLLEYVSRVAAPVKAGPTPFPSGGIGRPR